MLFSNLFKKTDDIAVTPDPYTHGEEEETLIALKLVKLPPTLELRNRQYEEELREKFHISKEKSGTLL